MAKEVLKNKERQVKLGQYDMLEASIPTLNNFTKQYITYKRDTEKKPSWKSDEQHLRIHLIPFFGRNRKLSDIKPQDVDDYKSSRLKEKAAPATVDRELSALRHLINLAERWNKFFGKNPVSIAGLLHPNNQKERTLTHEEQKRLLDSTNEYLRPIIIFALNTGMRKSEILTLKWSNVDLETGIITLEKSNTKSKKLRRIPINTVVRKLMLEQKLKGKGSEYVFLSSKGIPYKKEDSLRQPFLGALRRAGIEGLRFHDLRHTAATRMIESGASIVAVSKILGHEDLKTTMRYAHPEDSLKDAVELLTKPNFSNPVTDKSTDMGDNR
jgi:integrase